MDLSRYRLYTVRVHIRTSADIFRICSANKKSSFLWGHHPRCNLGLYHENMTANGRRCISSRVYIQCYSKVNISKNISQIYHLCMCNTSINGSVSHYSHTSKYTKLGSLLFRNLLAHRKTTEAKRKRNKKVWVMNCNSMQSLPYFRGKKSVFLLSDGYIPRSVPASIHTTQLIKSYTRLTRWLHK